MEVNAAIERLISENNPEDLSDAYILLEFMRDVESSGQFTYESRKYGSKSTTFLGTTPEHGDMPYTQRDSEIEEKSVGIHKERVGYYKVWTRRATSGQMIYFQYFWKSDLTTQGIDEPPQEYKLFFDSEGVPQYLGFDESKQTGHYTLVNFSLGGYHLKIEIEVYLIGLFVIRGPSAGRLISPRKAISLVRTTSLPW